MDYDQIMNPSKLLEYMKKNIMYGYLGNDNKIYYPSDKNFNIKWFNNYILESPEEVINNMIGTCYDQVEFEREWFIKHDFEIKTFFIIAEVDYANDFPTHTYLAYKDNDNWLWFENADYDNRGIHLYNNLDDLIVDQYNKQKLRYIEKNIWFSDIDNIHVYEYEKPKYNISAKEFIDHCTSSKFVK